MPDDDQMARPERLRDIVSEALELAPSAREAFLDTACGDDAALRADAASLLRHDEPARHFIARPAIAAHAEAFVETEGEFTPVATLRTGQMLGDFRIASLLGEGGMGEVYLAEDVSLGRSVAIKLVKAGVASSQLRQRFGAEKRILARLNDPHIARLYGGAVTPDGLPYFVMEYVEGERLDDYCNRRRLSIDARLELFRKVCAAVAYAHQNLVVHRDLKPANIRVTPAGEPKLLDFGIAKFLDPSEEGTADRTVTQLGAMTLAYASPEQLRGDPVTTATDTYSLAVVLYELLCGRVPFDPRHRQADLPAPRLVSVTPTGAVAEARDTTPARLIRQLTGDLDNIVQLALRTEPARRYPSVSQFSDDLARHLAAQPVTARKETLRYVVGRFVARNRAFAAAALFALLALVGGVVATGWQAHRANEQRLKAERRFEDVRGLADSLMGEIHDSVQDLAGATPTRKLIVSRALQYLDNLSRDADTPALRLDLAAAYRKIGDVQGNPYGSNLGDTDGALASYRKAESLLTTLLAATTVDSGRKRVELGRVERDLGDLAELRGDFGEMIRQYRRSLETFTRLAREQPKDIAPLDELARAYDTLGDGLNRTDNGGKEQVNCYEQALAVRQKVVAQAPGNTAYRRGLAIAFVKLGRSTVPDPSHGVADIARGADIMKGLAQANPDSVGFRRNYAMMLYYLGVAQTDGGDHASALASFTQVLPMRQQIAAADPKDHQASFDLAAVQIQLAEALTNTGHPEQALAHAQQGVTDLETLLTADPGNALFARNCGIAWRKLAEADAALATREISDKHARATHWSDARTAYEQAQKRFVELKAKGTVRTEDADMLDRLAMDIANCDRGLAQLKGE